MRPRPVRPDRPAPLEIAPFTEQEEARLKVFLAQPSPTPTDLGLARRFLAMVYHAYLRLRDQRAAQRQALRAVIVEQDGILYYRGADDRPLAPLPRAVEHEVRALTAVVRNVAPFRKAS